jgi:hypothetical protein
VSSGKHDNHYTAENDLYAGKWSSLFICLLNTDLEASFQGFLWDLGFYDGPYSLQSRVRRRRKIKDILEE